MLHDSLEPDVTKTSRTTLCYMILCDISRQHTVRRFHAVEEHWRNDKSLRNSSLNVKIRHWNLTLRLGFEMLYWIYIRILTVYIRILRKDMLEDFTLWHYADILRYHIMLWFYISMPLYHEKKQLFSFQCHERQASCLDEVAFLRTVKVPIFSWNQQLWFDSVWNYGYEIRVKGFVVDYNCKKRRRRQ